MKKNKEIEELTKILENVNTLSKEDEKDTEICQLLVESENYLLSHPWCERIEGGWLAISWGNILCVFLHKIISKNQEVDDYVWMVVGDIPPAYIDIESAKDPLEVLECYVGIMSDWVECVELGNSIEDCYPIEVPETKEYASMLKARLKFISEELTQ